MFVVGVDPGCRETGVVLIDGRDVVKACIVTRESPQALPDAAYLAEVLEVVAEYLEAGSEPLVAVETLVAPTGQLGRINVMGILGTAMVLGAVLTAHPDAVPVPPGGNGSAPMATYPELIQGKRGGKGADRFRHARSAYDVAIRV